MIVDKITLLISQVELCNKASYSELLDNLEDIELLIETGARLSLQLVLIVIRVTAAEAPWAGEVLLAEETPHTVPEWLATVVAFTAQVVLELVAMLRWLWVVVAILVLGFLHVVVQLLGHRVVEGEALVSSEDISDET